MSSFYRAHCIAPGQSESSNSSCMYIVTKCNTASKIQTYLHRAPLPSDPPVLSSMKAFYSHQSFPSAYEPAPPPSQPAKQRSLLFLVPCAVVYTQPRLAVGPLPSLGNGHAFLRTYSLKISLVCVSLKTDFTKTHVVFINCLCLDIAQPETYNSENSTNKGQ